MNVKIYSSTNCKDEPLVTFALFAYNQEKYIRKAIEGAFSQTYVPLEIILSDDCSSDRTFWIMQEMAEHYTGPHQIILNRNIKNTGLARHINHVMGMSKGELIVVAAGDDLSLPYRTTEIVNKWLENGKGSGSIYSHFSTINIDGVITPTLPELRQDTKTLTLEQRNIFMLNNFSGISGCTHAWTKDIFDIFGPIDNRIDHEDVIIPLRALLIGSITFLPLELVHYRLAKGSITRRTYSSGRERINKMEKYWAGRVAIFEQFSKDIEIAKTKGLLNLEDLAWLCNKAAEAERHARQTHQLFASSPLGIIRLLITPSFTMPLMQRMKWLIIALTPWVYGKM